MLWPGVAIAIVDGVPTAPLTVASTTAHADAREPVAVPALTRSSYEPASRTVGSMNAPFVVSVARATFMLSETRRSSTAPFAKVTVSMSALTRCPAVAVNVNVATWPVVAIVAVWRCRS